MVLERRRRDRPGIRVRRLDVAGIPLEMADVEGSIALDAVAGEIGTGAYDFSDIDFEPGDTVVDVGAHVGVVSIWLAKAHPDLRVLAFEPVPDVFELLDQNLRRNAVTNVTAVNRAVTGDGRRLDMVVHLASNTGGGTAQLGNMELSDHDAHQVPSTTLDAIFRDHGIGRCRLLKIDCEGSEHEVLLSSRCLDRVEHLRGEFHENPHLRRRGWSIDGLQRYCERYLQPDRIRIVRCEMADS